MNETVQTKTLKTELRVKLARKQYRKIFSLLLTSLVTLCNCDLGNECQKSSVRANQFNANKKIHFWHLEIRAMKNNFIVNKNRKTLIFSKITRPILKKLLL